MKETVSAISKLDFDYIIYDTPPALGISDSRFILNYLDGFFLIVSLFNVNRNIPKESLSNLSLSGIKPLGILTNLVNKESELKYNKQLKVSGLSDSQDYLKTYSHYINDNDNDNDPNIGSKNSFFEWFIKKSKLDKNKRVVGLFSKVINWLDE